MAEIHTMNAERAKRTQDNTLLSPAEMLEDCAKDLRSGEETATAALTLLLDKGENSFGVGYYASNISCSEMLALLECAKAKVLAEMGFAPE